MYYTNHTIVLFTILCYIDATSVFNIIISCLMSLVSVSSKSSIIMYRHFKALNMYGHMYVLMKTWKLYRVLMFVDVIWALRRQRVVYVYNSSQAMAKLLEETQRVKQVLSLIPTILHKIVYMCGHL